MLAFGNLLQHAGIIQHQPRCPGHAFATAAQHRQHPQVGIEYQQQETPPQMFIAQYTFQRAIERLNNRGGAVATSQIVSGILTITLLEDS